MTNRFSPLTFITTQLSTNGRMVSKSLILKSPLKWMRSERKVPEFRRAQSAFVAVSIMSHIKFPVLVKESAIETLLNLISLTSTAQFK